MSNAFEQIKPQATAAAQAGYETAELALSQVDRASKQALEHAKQHAEFAKAQFLAVSEIKDASQVFQFFQHQLEATAQYAAEVASEVYELNKEFHTELKDFAETHFDANHVYLNKLVADALKKAPEGSEAAVAAVKQAVDAGNKAIAQARDAAAQVVHQVNETVERVKSQTVKTKPAARSSRTRK